MNRINLLSFNKMKLESFDEHRKKHEPFNNGEAPTWTLSLACKAKRLVSKTGQLFDVLWAESIRIKPKKDKVN